MNLNFSKRYYKPGTKRYLDLKTEYNNLDPEVLEKVGYCIEHLEAFGLDSPESTYIFSFMDGQIVAASFDRAYNKKVVYFPNNVAFEIFISTILYSHDTFISPLNCHKFLLAVKALTNG